MIGVPFVALYATMNGLKTVHNPRATILKEFFVNGEFDLSNFEAEPLQKLKRWQSRQIITAACTWFQHLLGWVLLTGNMMPGE